ncbi:hypothetical protein HN51_021920 [Arachis hypogaea]
MLNIIFICHLFKLDPSSQPPSLLIVTLTSVAVAKKSLNYSTAHNSFCILSQAPKIKSSIGKNHLVEVHVNHNIEKKVTIQFCHTSGITQSLPTCCIDTHYTPELLEKLAANKEVLNALQL